MSSPRARPSNWVNSALYSYMIVAVSLHKTHIRVVKSLVKLAAVSWHSLQRFIKPASGWNTTGRTGRENRAREPGERTGRENRAREPGERTGRENRAREPGERTGRENRARKAGSVLSTIISHLPPKAACDCCRDIVEFTDQVLVKTEI